MATLDRTLSTVRAATTLAPTRPAYAAGIRAAVATVGPLAVAMLLGSQGGTWLSLGGFNAALSDRGGAYRDRATAMLAVVAGTAMAMLIGSLAGASIWIAVPVTFAVAVVCCLARVWGASGASIGGASLSTFVIALAYPAATLGDALGRAGLGMLGGLWAMVVALLLWPLRPYRPARVAVAACYTALAALLDEMVNAMARATPTSRPEVPVGSAVVRNALEHARGVLTQLRRGRPGASGRGEQLLVLGDLCDQMFGFAVGVVEAIETIPPVRRDVEAQRLVLEALSRIAATARAIAVAVEAETDTPSIPLGWSGEPLRTLVERTVDAEVRQEETWIHYLHAASILDRAARFAETAVVAVSTLGNGPGATTEFPVPDGGGGEEEPASPLAVVRAILTPDSVILHYALRVAVVSAVAVLLTNALHLQYGYWMTITVIVIMQPYTGATTHRALQRVIGTVIGGLLTAALGALFHDPRAILVLSFVFAATCVALMPLNYAAYSIFLTPTFVLLAEASVGDWHLAGVRVVNTLLGGALALAGARLLWPSPEWRRLPGYLAAALRANADYLRCVGSLFDDRSDEAGEQLRASRRRIGLAMVNAEESFQRLMGEHAGASDDLAPALSLLTFLRRFTASTASLALARHASPAAASALQPFTASVGGRLDELAEAVTRHEMPSPLPSMSSVEAAEEPVPPLLRARAERLVRVLRMIDGSVRRWTEAPEPASR
ncbi:MAG: hypothetical protein JWN79_953 [Gemmatimonadetes bacterium]|jgi:uncharacterized membrane protein YccC|nr:hypothetical protein [Gemmatimonadota bacterium]